MNKTKRTLREKKFIESYIENSGNATEAYLAINNRVNKNTAGVLGSRMLRKVKISINEFLDKLGLDNLALSQKLKEGLEAVKVIAGVEGPDHNVRVRYLDMAFKLKNVYPGEKGKLDEPEDVIIKVTYPEEKTNVTERLYFEINKIIEKRIENRDKYKDKFKEIDDDGTDQRSEVQKLADRLIDFRAKPGEWIEEVEKDQENKKRKEN